MCKYCENEIPIADYSLPRMKNKVYIENNKLYCETGTSWIYSSIYFCPMCGQKLGEKEKEVSERLKKELDIKDKIITEMARYIAYKNNSVGFENSVEKYFRKKCE